MRTMSKVAVALVCAGFVSGCSHIPTPVKAPELEPYYVLQKIRCEVGDALRDGHLGTAAQETDIAYGLTLKAVETGKNSLEPLSLVRTISLGTISLGASISAERERKNELVTNLAEGIDRTLSAPCGPLQDSIQWSYPITGKLGLRDVVRRYAEVSRIPGLKSFADSGFKQTLEFKLKFAGGLKPGFNISTDVNPTVDGTFNFSADREDYHELIIMLAHRDPPAVSGPIKVEITNFGDLASA